LLWGRWFRGEERAYIAWARYLLAYVQQSAGQAGLTVYHRGADKLFIATQEATHKPATAGAEIYETA